MEFKLEIIRSMLRDAGSHVEPSSEFDHLKGRHFAEVIPATEKKEKPQKRCVQKVPCFMIYHTKAIY